ncbi:MAG: hypothetical protein KDJ16_09190 [Hyphomicrobiales bacterium]|nr:hypothetical protein [Hyphomicrobiales bacterium]
MEHLRHAANISIGRACGFYGLGIITVMMGLSFDPLLATRSGAVLVTGLTIVLMIRARGALSQDYRRTEMWLLLEDDQRPPSSYAQWAASTVLRDAYLYFAQWAAGLSVLMWTVALLLALFAEPADRI